MDDGGGTNVISSGHGKRRALCFESLLRGSRHLLFIDIVHQKKERKKQGLDIVYREKVITGRQRIWKKKKKGTPDRQK